jgi:hypothetical protein
MDSKRENGECHTARALLRQLAAGKVVMDSWLVDFISRHPHLLKEGIVNEETFTRLAKAKGHVFLPKPCAPPVLSELVREPKPPKPPKAAKPPKPPRPPPPPLTPDQVPPRIFEAAEGFCHDFGLSVEERDALIRAVRRAFPGEYPKNGELRLAFYRHLLSTGAAEPTA